MSRRTVSEFCLELSELLSDSARLVEAKERIKAMEKDAALGAFVREYIKEANAGWTISSIYIQGAPSIETLDEALSHTK